MPNEQRALGTILLVEDEPSDARLLIRAFTRAGVVNPNKLRLINNYWLSLNESPLVIHRK